MRLCQNIYSIYHMMLLRNIMICYSGGYMFRTPSIKYYIHDFPLSLSPSLPPSLSFLFCTKNTIRKDIGAQDPTTPTILCDPCALVEPDAQRSSKSNYLTESCSLHLLNLALYVSNVHDRIDSLSNIFLKRYFSIR
jgi:hypothetical protein